MSKRWNRNIYFFNCRKCLTPSNRLKTDSKHRHQGPTSLWLLILYILSFFWKGYKFWYRGMSDLRARLALIAVALTMVGKIFISTMAPSNNGPKNGTYTDRTRGIRQNKWLHVTVSDESTACGRILTKGNSRYLYVTEHFWQQCFILVNQAWEAMTHIYNIFCDALFDWFSDLIQYFACGIHPRKQAFYWISWETRSPMHALCDWIQCFQDDNTENILSNLLLEAW